MKRIYPAGPFSWQDKVRERANKLVQLGYTITAQWLDQKPTFTNPDNSTNTKVPGLHATCQRLSIRDIRNIMEADTLVLFEPGIAHERVTRVAEFGLALGTGRQCIVIGPEDEDKKDVISSIFVKLYEIPEEWLFQPELGKIKPVIHYQTWDSFYQDITNPNPVVMPQLTYDCPGYTKWMAPESGLEVLPPK
jgi:hypothetical protein